jgi:hypothetical protein
MKPTIDLAARVLRGAGFTLLAALALFVMLLLIVIVLLALPMARVGDNARQLVRRRLFLPRVRKEWHLRSIYMLWVYSDSPHWKEYCETQILPRIRDHAAVLDWSNRLQWWRSSDLAVRIFKTYGNVVLYRRKGQSTYYGREFCPLAVVFPESGHVEVLRFYDAIRENKKGNPVPV